MRLSGVPPGHDPPFTSDFILNLSSYNLTASDISLLNKGLSFIPTVKSVKLSDLNFCVTRNIRNLKYKDFFQHKEDTYNPKDFINLFKSPPTWEPSVKQLSNDTFQSISEIQNFVAQYRPCLPIPTNTNTDTQFVRIFGTKDNLTKAERESLKSLASNSNIVIKQADKGGAVVLMDRHLYTQEGLRQLLNTHYYKQIEVSNIEQTCHKISKIIHSLFSKGVISSRQFKLLNPNTPHRPRAFYLLPKIHKPYSKWPHEKMPEGRPIVSDCSSETYYISKLVDYFLKPFSNINPGYIRDTYDFIHKIQNKHIPKTAYLVTGDVTALYTNMHIPRSIQKVRELFTEFPSNLRPDQEILDLLEICLITNEFEFDGKLFLQILGTAMGKAFAPNLANLYLRDIDLSVSQFAVDLYSRFIDDIFLIWLATLDELHQFETFINNIIPGIHISFSVNQQHIEFLDVLVYLTPSPHNLDFNIINTRVFFKDTDTHQLLQPSSHHPIHTTRGILKSQFIRFKRISSTRKDYDNSCRILFRVLRNRGYNRSTFRKLKNQIWYNYKCGERNNSESGKVWPIVHHFDPIGVSISRFFRSKIKSLPCSKGYRIVSAFKKHKNLGAYLTSSRFR